MNRVVSSMVLGTAGLWLAAAVSFWIAFTKPLPVPDARRLRWFLLVGVAAHIGHALEEYFTGFAGRFPSFVGLVPWPDAFFIGLNVGVVIAWTVSALAMPTRQRLAFAPIWFFALAGVMNGVGHPLLAALARGYSPGLVTSPAVGMAGALVWRELDRGGHGHLPSVRRRSTAGA